MRKNEGGFESLLRQHGFKVTSGRVALLQALGREEKPLTVAEVGKRLKSKLDSVTLYRALEAFVGKGVVRRVDLGHGHAHYELEQTHHHHMVCTNCGTIEDIESDALERAVSLAAKSSRQFKTIYSHNLEFFGNCKSCI